MGAHVLRPVEQSAIKSTTEALLVEDDCLKGKKCGVTLKANGELTGIVLK